MNIQLLVRIFLALISTYGYFTTRWSEGDSFYIIFLVKLVYLMGSLLAIYYLITYLQGV